MGTVYYGCWTTTSGGSGTKPPLDGNWNTVANWFSTLGATIDTCCCAVAAIPYGKVPQVGDSVVLFGNAATPANNIISTGPAGGWSGPVSWFINANSSTQLPVLGAGTYSGTITIGQSSSLNYPISGGPNTGADFGISGGNYSGTVHLEYPLETLSGLSNTSLYCIPTISGGTFSGNVTRLQITLPDWWTVNRITGGIFAPAVNIPYQSPNSIVVADLPTDPGFAIGGGSYAPVVTLTGLPDILGAGLPA
jgi:hypothetical protein